MHDKTIIIAGGTGFIGKHTASYFKEKGYDIVILTRDGAKIYDGKKFIHWNGKTIGSWSEHIDGSFAVINLTGHSVNCIFNDKNKRAILDSRVDSIRVLIESIQRSARPPCIFIQAGSLAIYGDTAKSCDETAPLGKGFAANVCKKLETNFYKSTTPKTRKILYRLGFILGENGGVLATFSRLARWCLGGTMGSGTQYISWLHIEDLNRMFAFAIDNVEVEGTYNVTGINPVSNAVLMKTLREAMDRPWSPPLPRFLVTFGSYLLSTEPSLALTGQKCIPKRLLKHGYKFKHVDLYAVLKKLTKSPN